MNKINYIFEFFLVFLFFSIFSFFLHHSAMNGFWRFDDGAHLLFVLKYSPWQYFFDPNIMLIQSNANITPWNAFFYDINISLFGLSPKYFYLHLILILTLSSVATYYLIKLWQIKSVAFLSGMFFLVGLPTSYVAQEIMTGHYAIGLLFSIISLYLYCLGISKSKWSLILLGALFYLLATTCKEVYVPLVIILIFMPLSNLNKKMIAAIPYVIVFIFYMLWRFSILDSFIGGYTLGHEILFNDKIKQLINIPTLLWKVESNNYLSFIAPTLFMIGTIISFYKRKINILLFFIVFVILLFPIYQLTKFPGINAPDRYLFLLWWCTSLLFSIALFSMNKNWIFPIIIIILLFQIQRKELNTMNNIQSEILYQYAINPNENTVLFLKDTPSHFKLILTDIKKTYELFHGKEYSKLDFAINSQDLCSYVKKGKTALMYDNNTMSLVDITNNVSNIINDIQKEYTKRQIIGEKLSLKISKNDIYIKWEFQGNNDSEYAIFYDGDRYPLTKTGQIVTNLEDFKATIQLQTTNSQGFIAMSPIFDIHLKNGQKFYWEGKSIDNTINCNLIQRDKTNEFNRD